MLQASEHRRITLYEPDDPCAFSAWVTPFDYGDGRLGLSFTEIRSERDPCFRAPRLEFGEAVGAPVSYCSAECGSPDKTSYRVYLASEDGGHTFHETGRCRLKEGSFCNMGFPDNRIVGLDVGRINEAGTGWCDYIAVRESTDGGSTWQETTRLFEGCALYLWRVRRLRDGSFLVLACFYGTNWGVGMERPIRNSMLPDETHISKIQTFFLHTHDGRSFSGPHYVLPGIGAGEYDVAELDDGRLLFFASDTQATPCGRQLVTRTAQGFINGALLPVHRGAPKAPDNDPQGGYCPESIVCLPGNLLIGVRRNRPFTCSSDLGGNWYQIDHLPQGLYQPVLTALPDRTLLAFGHVGGDNSVGQVRMSICVDRFHTAGLPPQPCKLTLARDLSADGRKYINAFTAALSCGGKPLAGQRVLFRMNPLWTDSGAPSTVPQANAPDQIAAVTDQNGLAHASVPAFDAIRDVHFYYNVDALFVPDEAQYLPCASVCMSVAALTAERRCRHPYPAYFAEGTLFISPELELRFPRIYEQLRPFVGSQTAELNDRALAKALCDAGVAVQAEDGTLRWKRSVHSRDGLQGVLPQGDGDWYV